MNFLELKPGSKTNQVSDTTRVRKTLLLWGILTYMISTIPFIMYDMVLIFIAINIFVASILSFSLVICLWVADHIK